MQEAQHVTLVQGNEATLLAAPSLKALHLPEQKQTLL